VHRDNTDTIATLFADVLERTFQSAARGAKPVKYDVAMGLGIDEPVKTGQLDSAGDG